MLPGRNVPEVEYLSRVTCDTSCWRALYTNQLSFATIFVAVVKYFAALHGGNCKLTLPTGIIEVRR